MICNLVYKGFLAWKIEFQEGWLKYHMFVSCCFDLSGVWITNQSFQLNIEFCHMPIQYNVYCLVISFHNTLISTTFCNFNSNMAVLYFLECYEWFSPPQLSLISLCFVELSTPILIYSVQSNTIITYSWQ